jgi:hypothetical protein
MALSLTGANRTVIADPMLSPSGKFEPLASHEVQGEAALERADRAGPDAELLKLFDLGPAETKACMLLVSERREAIRKTDESVVGFNLGANDAEEAGQTVDHCHWHLIPRRKGDVADPRGGVRGVIPGKASD